MKKAGVAVANPSLHKCFSCDNNLLNKEIICNYCAAINDGDYNFFDILSLDVAFNLNNEEIEKNYLRLQKQVHPDNYSTKSKREQETAFKYSSLANEAYHILKNRRLRGEYILALSGIRVNSDRDNVLPPQELLREIFATRDHVQDAGNLTELMTISQENEKSLQKTFDDVSLYFQQNSLNHAASSLIKARYLEKIKEEINLKTRILQNESNPNH